MLKKQTKQLFFHHLQHFFSSITLKKCRLSTFLTENLKSLDPEALGYEGVGSKDKTHLSREIHHTSMQI